MARALDDQPDAGIPGKADGSHDMCRLARIDDVRRIAVAAAGPPRIRPAGVVVVVRGQRVGSVPAGVEPVGGREEGA